ncbi:polysaccharide deacetylase family protein [Allopusillimonas ginsengisoli]|uniref:polysaccharide deacetylase family protein n=1 Tax=Allopusillimonas ginsengisoli TaxID=453575 RepID=UPI00101FAC34|nr:polysaccharide deacetylase family protein [Allopusillimonas ginsengisoli]TEA78386.1 hypothetical protein ERE07_08180 [Allopusillimonas ginsengisoli]
MRTAPVVPVLMYHHVTPSKGMITTSPENFENQLAWLKRHGYRSLTCADFAQHLNGHPVAHKSILITFDDGYLDNWVYAYPLLKRYGFNAALFLVTSWIGEGPKRQHLGQGVLPETPMHHECTRRIAAGRIDDVMLRWSEVEHMRNDGVFEFHSHSHTHKRWDKISPENRLVHVARELDLSRQTLQEKLGEVSDHFCWPEGYFEQDYIPIAQQAGFRYLYTTTPYGQNRPGTDPAGIYRASVRNRGGKMFGQRVWIARNPMVGPVYNRWRLWKRSNRKHE